MKHLLILLFILLVKPLWGQHLNYIHYNTNNSNIPHDLTYKIRQDQAGFIWIGTDDGLVKFDGVNMVNVDEGFTSKYVISTDEDHGRTWACTWKGGIYYLSNDTAIRVKTNSKSSYYYDFNTNGIIVFDDLIISHAFDQYIVFQFDSIQNLLTPYSLKQKKDTFFFNSPGDREYYHFIKTKQHRLFAYNATGVYEVVDKKIKKINTGLFPEYIWESPLGELYFQKDRVIYLTDPGFTSARKIFTVDPAIFGSTPLTKFRVFPSGNIYLGFMDTVKYHSNLSNYFVNPHTGEITDLSKEILYTTYLADIVIDREGGIWVSSDGRGVFHIFDRKYEQIGGDGVFINSWVTTMYSHGKDSLYIGTKEGVYLYHKGRTEFLKYKKYKNNYQVKNIFKTRTGDVGVSLKTGSQKLDLNVGYTIKNGYTSELNLYDRMEFKNYVVCIYTNPTGEIKDTKIDVFNKQETTVYSDHLEPYIDYYISAEDGMERLWLSTGIKLFYFHPSSGLHEFNHPGFRHHFINCMYYVEENGLYIGTNLGLFLLHDDGSIQSWGVQEGLSNINVQCIYAENMHSLWIGTQNGLFHFKNNQFHIYKKRDGLIADDVKCIEPLNKEELAIGSSKGVTVFSRNPAPETPAALNIEKLEVDGKLTDWKKPVDIPYNSTISLYYHAITFIYPELVQYAYRLNDHEPWIYTENTSLVFTHLKPGDYQLQLRAKKYNTAYSTPVIIHFKILAPWWRSVWFYIGLLFISVLLVYFILYQQLNKKQKNTRARQELAELKMKALQAQLNPHFVSNALNAIHYFILKQDEISANRYLGQFADLTRSFLEVSRTRLVTLEKELELLKNYLSLEKLRFENKFDHSIIIDKNFAVSQTYIPGLLIQPFVENSINHGLVYLPKDKPGKVSVKVMKNNEYLEVTIDDNGIGREKAREIKNRSAKSHQSHSTNIVDELKEVYNSLPGCFIEIKIDDKKNEEQESLGTTVYIRIKINKEILT